jgi:UDP-GlcNAc:undecaprenyl-phosphate/decaprenyl-phosphate GlcNAc-1-phosphate transferase
MIAKDAEIAFTALAVTLAVAWAVIRICTRIGIFDLPGPLKIHTRPVPRLGGVAIACGLTGGLIVGETHSSEKWPVLAAFAVVWIIGLVDDLRSSPPFVRLAAQFLSALSLWYGGFGVRWTENEVLSLVATSALVIVFVNGWNFLDGSDGVATGVTAITALAFLFVPLGVAGSPAAPLAISIVGACSGFLVLNFHPAKLFLGDSGSTTLGLALAFLTLSFYHTSSATLTSAAFPLFAAGLPLVDAGLAVIRRMRNLRSPLRGDRLHIYDGWLAWGWSAKKVALAAYAVTLLLATAGVLAVRTNESVFLLCDGLTVAALLFVALGLNPLSRRHIADKPAARSPFPTHNSL